jgi:hypothetical protein
LGIEAVGLGSSAIRAQAWTAARAGVGAACLWLSSLGGTVAAGAGESLARAALVQEEARLEAAYSGGQVIEHQMLWVRPPGTGPFPLAVVTHGSARRGDRSELKCRVVAADEQ